ncbi:MAG TPA: MBL fold metallo-hydrolase [Oscillospiraceae bacterium]|nr:MBL fold metallo-hydrolase [Oscillospiraceae bacterium]
MFVERIPAGIYAVNCYVLWDKATNKATVIDPGGDVDRIIKMLEDNNLELEYIILTHAHVDHIGGVQELKDRMSVFVYMHKDDLYMLMNGVANQSVALGGPIVEAEADEFVKFVEDGDVLELGESELSIIHTPGHTEGGICIQAGDFVFTGDTLFASSIGRSDLEGGNEKKLMDSLKNKVLTLDDDLKVLPGHGPATTIGIEKDTNPFVI